MTTKTTTHTPGPWELSEGNTSLWGTSPFNARVRIGNIVKHSSMNGIDYEANARLIASAPCLLKALETIVKDIENNSLGNALSVARFAISKARGEV